MSKIKNRKRVRAQRGMTLIEIMVVIVILGILGTFIGMNVFSAVDDSKESKAITELSTIKTALARTYGKFSGPNGLPKSLSELVPKYLEDAPEDPWGNEYIYKNPGDNGKRYTIYSKGPDGQDGTDDDIYLKKRKKK